MDLAIICPSCQGSGYRVCVVGYTGTEMTGEILVPRECEACTGTGRVVTSGWSEV